MLKKHGIVMEDTSMAGGVLKRRSSSISVTSISMSPSQSAPQIGTPTTAANGQFSAMLVRSGEVEMADNNEAAAPLSIVEQERATTPPTGLQIALANQSPVQQSVIVSNSDDVTEEPQLKAPKTEPPNTHPQSMPIGGKFNLEVMMAVMMQSCQQQQQVQMQIEEQQQQQQQPTNNESVTAGLACQFCSRNFPSKFSLVAHQYRDHGEAATVTATSQAGINAQSTTPQKRPSHEYLGVRHTPPYRGALDGSGSVERPTNLAGVDPEAYCELCKKEFCSKYFLKTHKANIHGIRSNENSMLIGNSPNQGGNLMGQQQNGGMFSMTNSEYSLAVSGVSPQRGSAPGQGGRFVTGKNFCDLCNKELCNKYFLRTHMLKMHGVVIDENKTVIGNINTIDREKMGGLVFRCSDVFSNKENRFAEDSSEVNHFTAER